MTPLGGSRAFCLLRLAFVIPPASGERRRGQGGAHDGGSVPFLTKEVESPPPALLEPNGGLCRAEERTEVEGLVASESSKSPVWEAVGALAFALYKIYIGNEAGAIKGRARKL